MRARQTAIERRTSCRFLACVPTAPPFQPVSPLAAPFRAAGMVEPCGADFLEVVHLSNLLSSFPNAQREPEPCLDEHA